MKMYYVLFLMFGVVSIFRVESAVLETEDISEQGLYSKSDHVVILTQRNFDKKVYGQNHALVVQFYNSYCGHCRAFSPKFKNLAFDIIPWRNVFQLAVMDCSVEENNEVCRQFEVMAYPSLRYIHENYIKANANVGEKLYPTETADLLKAQIVNKMQNEQSKGRLQNIPPLNIASYSNFMSALKDNPSDIYNTFLVFESENSTVGTELILDTNDYAHIRIKRVHETSELSEIANVRHFPGLVAVKNTLETTPLTPKKPSRKNLLNTINTYLRSIKYSFPNREIEQYGLPADDQSVISTQSDDVVYYSDLEKTLKTALHTEITRYKILEGEPLHALIEFLDVIVTAFPFENGGRDYFIVLRDTLSTRKQWSGSDIYDLVKHLEDTHSPVYTSNLEYIGCRGSSPKYRGYSCGLWTLFHTLTVNAAQLQGNVGPNVLKAMYGYIKHFFGCTDCSEHFQAMAERNKLFDVKENDKAVLWLWISHNEVNLRLAGDITEDPMHPKIQFPSSSKCKECRLARGAWNLPAVLQYLQGIYGAANIRRPQKNTAGSAPSPFSNLDIGMLSLLSMQA